MTYTLDPSLAAARRKYSPSKHDHYCPYCFGCHGTGGSDVRQTTCYDDGDDHAFGPCYLCGKLEQLASQRGVAVQGFVAAWWVQRGELSYAERLTAELTVTRELTTRGL